MPTVLQASDRMWNSLSQSRPTQANDDRHDLLRRAHWLPQEQQQLLQLWITGGHRVRHMAQALQINPGLLWRRLMLLRKRLRDPIVIALTDHGQSLPQQSLQIGIEFFLLKHSLADICRQRDLSIRELKGILIYLKAWALMAPLLQQHVASQSQP